MNNDLGPEELKTLADNVEAGIKLVKSHKNFWDGKETDEQRRLRLSEDEDSFRLIIEDLCLITFVHLVKMADGKPIKLMTYPIVEACLPTTLVELLSYEFETCQDFLRGVEYHDSEI